MGGTGLEFQRVLFPTLQISNLCISPATSKTTNLRMLELIFKIRTKSTTLLNAGPKMASKFRFQLPFRTLSPQVRVLKAKRINSLLFKKRLDKTTTTSSAPFLKMWSTTLFQATPRVRCTMWKPRRTAKSWKQSINSSWNSIFKRISCLSSIWNSPRGTPRL